MKDKIELSFEAFKRWHKSIGCTVYTHETTWQSLCAEAEKREPIVQWAVIQNGNEICFYSSQQKAEAEVKEHGGKAIKLVEVGTEEGAKR